MSPQPIVKNKTTPPQPPKGAKKPPQPELVTTDTLVSFQWAEDQINKFYERWDKNLDVVKDAAHIAYENVKAIVEMKDEQKASWGWVLLDLALQIALPGVMQFSKTYTTLMRRYADSLAKKTGVDHDEVLEDLKDDMRLLVEISHRGATRIKKIADGYEETAATTALTTHLQTLAQVKEQIGQTKSRLQVAKENRRAALRKLLWIEGNKLNVQDPDLVGDIRQAPKLNDKQFGSIVYAMEWMMLATYVRRHLQLKIYVDSRDLSRASVVSYAPSGLSKTACETIFKRMTRTLEMKTLVLDPESPMSRAIFRPVTSWENFANVWVCDVMIVMPEIQRGRVGSMLIGKLGKLHQRLAQRAKETQSEW
jgi:hypothetical protein